jgi:hypothetical protein
MWLEIPLTPLELAAIVLGFAMLGMALPPAILLLTTGRGRLLSFTGALYLVLLGSIDALYSLSLLAKLVTHDPVLAANAAYYTIVGFLVTPFAYLAFVGQAVPSPLVQPLRRKGVLFFLAASGTAFLLYLVVAAGSLATAAPDEVAGVHIVDWLNYLYYVFAIVLTFGVVAAASAFVRAPKGTIARRRARLYLIAFGLNDLGIVFAILEIVLYLQFHLFSQDFTFFVYGVGSVAVQLAGLAVLIWAGLRWSLLGIEIKLKHTVRRGTVAAVFVGAFFIVSAVAEQYLQQYGYVIGGLAVGVLLFATVPIRRAAEKISDRAFPGVSDSPDYVTKMKVAFYQEALHDALLPSGALDPARTGTLRQLRTSLALSQHDHDVLLAATTGGAGGRRAVTVAPGATVLGKYLVQQEIGSGGGGRAFLAQDVRIQRKVVLKTVSGADQAAAVREARAAAAIEHPNVVRVYDVEDLGAEAILVLEHVDGGSLKDRIAASGALSASAFARVSEDVLLALEAVHAAGAVHRDVKPGNILLTRAGRAKLSDFGIARLAGYDVTMGAAPTGSVQYMSPEQARGKRVTAASDLYSAAATLYEAQTGWAFIQPRPGESPVEMQSRVAAGHLLDKKTLKPALAAWFARALAVAPDERFQSAADMHTALLAALSSSSTRRARSRASVAGENQ